MTRTAQTPEEIIIDDAGWGDLILGVVIGSLELPAHRYLERRIPVSSFQTPHFEGKEYLNMVVTVVKEVIKVMKVDEATKFKVCSGYVLSEARRFLQENGFNVEKVKVAGELQRKVERGYVNWCIEVGVPEEILSQQSGKNRFWKLFSWVKENPKQREMFVKTGWKSWKRKWRKIAYNEI